MSHFAPFSGSYKPDDVHSLLKPIVMEITLVDLKEELIQSGKMQYSD
ncbi:cysteine protease StiP domain-containing protein, partial [Klebsiella quasipneumoniae]